MQGRFNQVLHVPTPSLSDKQKLVKYYLNKFKIPENSETLCYLKDIEERIQDNRLSGADIENMCRELGMSLLRNLVLLSKK